MPPAGGPCGQSRCQLVKATRRGDGASDEPPWLVSSHWQLPNSKGRCHLATSRLFEVSLQGPSGPCRASAASVAALG